jgi:hypothetical protein
MAEVWCGNRYLGNTENLVTIFLYNVRLHDKTSGISFCLMVITNKMGAEHMEFCFACKMINVSTNSA